MLSAGTIYTFSVWAPYLKSSTGFSQTRINIIGSFGNIGSALGIIAGLVFDRYGPIPTALISTALLFSGYFLIYCSLAGSIPSNFFLYLLLNFVVGQGSSYAYATSLSTNIRNFSSKHRGLVVGVLVSFYGLSGAILTSAYELIFVRHGGVLAYIFVLIVFTTSLSLIGGLLQSYPPEHPDFDENDTLLDFPEHTFKDENAVSGKQLLKQKEFWILVCLMMFGTSTGALYINIIGSLYLSLGAAPGDQNLSVLLISLMNAVGRLSAGLITDSLAHKMKRTVLLATIYLLFSATWVFLGTFESLTVLPFTSLAVGFCYGATLCAIPTITSELFGVCTFAENWGSIQPANAVGTVVLGVIAGILYDQQLGENTKHCIGHSCYAHTFLLLGALCFATFLLTCYLTHLLPPTSGSHKHVLFPKLPHHKALLLCNFFQPFHHHHRHSKSPYIIQQEARRGSVVEKKGLNVNEPDKSFLPAP